MATGTRTYLEMMQQIADDYFAETGDWRATTSEMADWALSHGVWEPPAFLAKRILSRDLSRAMRGEYLRDGRGNSVRTKHAARIRVGSEQQTFWADIRNAPRDHMELAFQQRRRQIVGDCRQLKLDADFYNSEHPKQEVIQMIFNFEEDLEEIEAEEMDMDQDYQKPSNPR